MVTQARTELERVRTLLCVPAVERVAPREVQDVRSPSFGLQKRLDDMLCFAGYDCRANSIVMVVTIAAVFSAALSVVVHWSALPILGLFLTLGVLFLQGKARKRAEAFEQEFAALLVSLASAVRTGLDPMTALCNARHFFPKESEIHKELGRVHTMLESGAREEEALMAFGATIAQPDVRLFQTAFLLSREQGASLGECLQRLLRVTRHRQSFRRKVRSAVALQKLSAYGILLCTVVIGIVQAVANPTALLEALHHPVAVKVLASGVSLIVLGIGLMMRMTRVRV